MIPHIDVHGRGHDHGRSGSKIKCAEKIVTETPAEFGENVRSGWSDEQKIGSLRDSNMFDRTFEIGFAARLIKKIGDHFFSGERSEEHTSELQSRLHLVCR